MQEANYSMTPKEIAEKHKISEWYVINEIKWGFLKATQPKKKGPYLISVEDYAAWCEFCHG
jgi:hypothetical protein